MTIRRRRSQIDKTGSMSNKKRLDERIKQHVKKFRIPLNKDNINNHNTTSTVANYTPPQIARDLTPTPPPTEEIDLLNFLSDLFPASAFIDQADPSQSIRGLTNTNQTVPGSLISGQSAQAFFDPITGMDFPNTGQAVPNDNPSLGIVYGQTMNDVQMQMANQQHYHHHQQRNHPHTLQQWESAPNLISNLIEPLYITSPPVIQVNNQPAPLSTAAPQIVTQKPHRTPSRPNPPTFANGPSYVRASPDLLTHFSDFDTDGSGAISFDELQSSLTNREVSKSRHFNSEVITVLIEMFDNISKIGQDSN
ncbi:hypothetical protein K501DRAFT_281101 [Backusella circina FSU 941]|nr:hypothetical protein K501DRAFT_281101 [Backusella circina FSU 941]